MSDRKLYAEREPWNLEPHYSAHVQAMTAEGLHEKSEIAAELAWRDTQIRALQDLLGRVAVWADALRGDVAEDVEEFERLIAEARKTTEVSPR